jgi:hypothetical protein
MKNIDIEAIQKRRLENYEREKDNLIVVKIPNGNGYEVSNINKATVYTVSKDPSGLVACTCKDYYNYRQFNINCKHKIAVSRKVNKANNLSTEGGDINNIKEELIMSNSNVNNNISKFNPQTYMTKVKGKDYLEVKYRIHWFRTEHPSWDIRTEIVNLDLEKGIALVRADILDETGKHLSSGMKMEYQKTFFDYCEKSETGAIGRALACLGYGTLQCFELEEGIEKGRIVDAPVTPPTVSPKAPATPTISTIPTAKTQAPAHTPAPAQKTTGGNTAFATQHAGSIPRQNGGNGKGNNGNGGNGKTDISNIIKRW